VSTTPVRAEAVPLPYAGLLDDRSVLPPGEASLAVALTEHRRHRDAWYADLVGPFVVDDRRLTSLLELLDPDDPTVPVTVVVTGGAGAVEPAARWAVSSPALDLWGLEVGLRDLDDLPGSARRVVAATQHLTSDLGVDVPVHVGAPLAEAGSAAWLAALDEVAAADLRLAFATGGPDGSPVAPTTLAGAIEAALDRELAFRCTGGPGVAISGSGRLGFLNILLATRASLDGGDVTAVLTEEDPAVVLGALGSAGAEGLVGARRWFTSSGCAGVAGPVAELVGLGVLTGQLG